MKLDVDQVFYGRGINGYGILGASSGGRPFAARVESLCGAVGTPGVDYGSEPFLMSVPQGDSVVMVCGRRGVPDSMGRSTLFFHALVAGKTTLAEAKTDAFSLFEQGVFLDELPGGDIKPLCIEVTSSSAVQPQGDNVSVVELPCLFRTSAPAARLVRSAVGNRANDLSWATFTFQPMRGFDVQVLSPRVSGPRNANEYDATGRLIRSAATMSSSKEDAPPRKYLDERPYPSSRQIVNITPKGKSSAMLALSVAINIALAAVCAALLASHRSIPDSVEKPEAVNVVTNTIEKIVGKTGPVQLSYGHRAEIEDAIARYRSKQKDQFPTESRQAFLAFNKTAAKLFGKYYGPAYDGDTEENKVNFKEEHEFLCRLKSGIDFVNEEILEKETP